MASIVPVLLAYGKHHRYNIFVKISTMKERASLGGYARAKRLSAERRRRIAKDAANARWSKTPRTKRGG